MLHKELMPPKPEELIIFVNGEFLPDSQAKISVLDHGLMYGDGCFDVAESWRCVFIPSWGTWGSQVCRSGIWSTYHLNPSDCAACCDSYSGACE